MSTATQPLKDQAYRAILDRLMCGAYAPGDSLDRRRMALDLRMSVAPVHEAMNQLEWEGLLSSIPRRGTQVRPVKREDVCGHLILREALESQIARLICGARVQREQESLIALAEAADDQETDEFSHRKQEIAFHLALCELTECALLLEHYRQVMTLGAFYRVSMLLPFTSRNASAHTQLLESLITDDTAVAETAVREHLWAGKPAWMRQLCYGVSDA